MFSTTVAILAAVALLSPGFVIVEIGQARGARSSRSDLELALRSIFYAVVVHLLAGYWTVWLVDDVSAPAQWTHHLIPLGLYVFVVLIVVPVALGLALAEYTQRVEQQSGPPGIVAAALGIGVARDAFDYAFQHHRAGALVVVELTTRKGDTPERIGGIYGKGSAIGQSPQPHDIYLEELAVVGCDDNGDLTLTDTYDPKRSVYIAGSQIARIHFLPEADRGVDDGAGADEPAIDGAPSAEETAVDEPAGPR